MRSTLALLLLFGAVIGVYADPDPVDTCTLYKIPTDKPCKIEIKWKVHNDVQATATCLEYFPTTFVTGQLIFDAGGIKTEKINCTVQVAYQCLEPDSFAMFDKCYKFPNTMATASRIDWDSGYPLNECSDLPGISDNLGLKNGKLIDMPPEVRAPAVCCLAFFQECENRGTPCGPKAEYRNEKEFNPELQGFFSCHCPDPTKNEQDGYNNANGTITCEWNPALADNTCAWLRFYDGRDANSGLVRKDDADWNDRDWLSGADFSEGYNFHNDKLDQVVVRHGCKVTVRSAQDLIDWMRIGYGVYEVIFSLMSTVVSIMTTAAMIYCAARFPLKGVRYGLLVLILCAVLLSCAPKKEKKEERKYDLPEELRETLNCPSCGLAYDNHAGRVASILNCDHLVCSNCLTTLPKSKRTTTKCSKGYVCCPTPSCGSPIDFFEDSRGRLWRPELPLIAELRYQVAGLYGSFEIVTRERDEANEEVARVRSTLGAVQSNGTGTTAASTSAMARLRMDIPSGHSEQVRRRSDLSSDTATSPSIPPLSTDFSTLPLGPRPTTSRFSTRADADETQPDSASSSTTYPPGAFAFRGSYGVHHDYTLRTGSRYGHLNVIGGNSPTDFIVVASDTHTANLNFAITEVVDVHRSGARVNLLLDRDSLFAVFTISFELSSQAIEFVKLFKNAQQ